MGLGSPCSEQAPNKCLMNRQMNELGIMFWFVFLRKDMGQGFGCKWFIWKLISEGRKQPPQKAVETERNRNWEYGGFLCSLLLWATGALPRGTRSRVDMPHTHSEKYVSLSSSQELLTEGYYFLNISSLLHPTDMVCFSGQGKHSRNHRG